MEFNLLVLPMGNSSGIMKEMVTRCFLNTLGWQNIQLTWPFYSSFIESKLLALARGRPEVTTEYLTNVTEFEEILDLTIASSHEEGSSRDWVVNCGVEQVNFTEVCSTALNVDVDKTVNMLSCDLFLFAARAADVRVFNMSGVQIIYVGGGLLVVAKSVSFVRSYQYGTFSSTAKDTIVSVCGEKFETADCRLPLTRETMMISDADGNRRLKYKGKMFLQDQVTYLPDGWILICSSIFLVSEEPYISFSDPLTVLNFVGYCLSIVALLATFVNYCMFRVLRNVPGAAIMSLAAALFLAQLLTLTVLDKVENVTFCIAMAVLMHYMWLATFTWMNVLAWDLMRTFTSKQAARPNRRIFLGYCLYGWGLPALIVTTCLVIHSIHGHSLGFRYGGELSCWVVGKYAVLGAFLAPMVCSLIANVVLFSWTVRSVHASLAAAAMVRRDKSKSRETLGELRIYFKVSCVMGFTWLFGCLGSFVDHQAIWYLFIILNSLQGVFIFVSFGCNLRIRNLWREKLGIKAGRKTKASRNSSNISSTRTNRTPAMSEAVTMTTSISLHSVKVSTPN
ncbi:adhesion G-protein coupled receptor G6-like [Acanthaster planci]|uniref:Adhesion G-protein coupled receptor G6-like n=1 Tax=Acanthaster planci TaxID=133434 RepID=A0A8B7XP42_ACAPL|nr:adhesion G-protein coupled receptor G6-like [Acanthaster planci]